MSITPDTAGAIALAGYFGVGVFLVWYRLRKYSPSLREALFTLTIRIYAPFMFGQRFRQRCPWPETGPALIVANHSSPTDPIMIHSASLAKSYGMDMRIVEWLTAREYCEQGGVIQLLCEIARCIPVDRVGRDMAAVRDAIRRAKEGAIIGIFPEGGLNDGVNLREFHTGVAFLAFATKIPVYPVFIENSPKSSSMVKAFLTKSTTRVHFGDALDLSKWSAKKRPSAEDLEAATAQIRRALMELGGMPVVPDLAIAGQIKRSAG